MLKPALQLRLGQQLTMTPQLQQAIRLLQLPALDLQQTIREALEQNVMLEADDDNEAELPLEAAGAAAEPGPDAAAAGSATGEATEAEADIDVADDAWDESAPAGPSDTPWSGDDRPQEFSDQRGETLQEHLVWQLELARLGARELAIGRAIIDAINDDGYLVDPLEDIAAVLRPDLEVDAAEIERVLRVVQAFDPPGIGARSVAECIELQLAQLAPDTAGLGSAIEIARHHLDLVATQQLAVLRRTLSIDEEELSRALALVRSCHPRPGSTIQPTQPDYVVPDVFVRRGQHGWVAELNAGALPRVRLNQSYAGLVTRAADHAVLRTQLQEARWLLRSLEIRNETLIKVARCIVQRQSAFLDQGDEAMEPMVLRDVAEAVEMHESTISRVTTGKYMHTPRGVYEFRYFFSSHVAATDGTEIASTAIRAKIKKLIAGEDPGNPLSDSRIAELLAADGARVARRTVAKYREAMQIAPSSERRRVPAR
ncbi:MAG TPA: RNA polymerase factor sigma-54 [Steroidobacteraceae bacterium]|nr:RNA polymerase factor sigma-54 [Steroidobacteraceae bacterium]